TIGLENLVSRTLLGIDCQVVAKPRAATTFDTNSQTAFGDTLIVHDLFDSVRRFLSQLNHRTLFHAVVSVLLVRPFAVSSGRAVFTPNKGKPLCLRQGIGFHTASVCG